MTLFLNENSDDDSSITDRLVGFDSLNLENVEEYDAEDFNYEDYGDLLETEEKAEDFIQMFEDSEFNTTTSIDMHASIYNNNFLKFSKKDLKRLERLNYKKLKRSGYRQYKLLRLFFENFMFNFNKKILKKG
jgi:hypothetical protein